MTFSEMNLDARIMKAIEDQGYKKATAIQEKAIRPLLKGRDLLGCAQTGTGKTAAFALPILQRLSQIELDPNELNPIRALILAPTRELALQIGESFTTYGRYLDHHTGVVYGGVTPKRHIKVLKREPSILVATPGRLLDLYERECLDLSHIEYFVIDEADRMLDLGMIKDVRAIIAKLPLKRQNMMFSATMPSEVNKLVKSILKNPLRIKVEPTMSLKKSIKQVLYYVDDPDKTALLLHLLKDPSMTSVLVFARTKKNADKVGKAINIANIRAKVIHGDKGQSERIKALELFKNKEVRVLVATDVAARGIDIDRLSHVVNMNVPNVPETYIHRIGRTGRAGEGGCAITFCSNQETSFIGAVEQLQKQRLEVVKNHPYPLMNMVLEQNRKEHR